MAKLSPSKVIELAYMSALLERRITCGDDGKDDWYPLSKRYSNVKAFFESVIPVVPAESLFHAMAVSNPYTVWQCCEMLSTNVKLFQENDSSKFLTDGMHLAKEKLVSLERGLHAMSHIDDEEEPFDMQAILEWRSMESMVFRTEIMNVAPHGDWTMKKVRDLYHDYVTAMKSSPLQMAEQFIENYWKSKAAEKKLPSKRSLCGLNLEDLYTASQDDVRYTGIEHPLTLLKNGRDELNALSEEMSSQSHSAANANSEMLEKLNDLCGNFRTCSALLGSFMEAHVHVPLELQDDKQARKIATAAESGGLKVWALLILPISYVKRIIARILEESQKLLVDVTSYMRNLSDAQIHSRNFRRSPFRGSYYAGKLEFLMTSMKKSSSSNKSFIAYSLERQLVEEFKKRHIDDMTSLDEILQQWEANFEDEVLTMVDENYRPMIARWIKWSLMINRLRESLAAQTAVGVIGLVNSGKSKFVRSMFGIKVGNPSINNTDVMISKFNVKTLKFQI